AASNTSTELAASLATNNSRACGSNETPGGQLSCVLDPLNTRTGGTVPDARRRCATIDGSLIVPEPAIANSRPSGQLVFPSLLSAEPTPCRRLISPLTSCVAPPV